MAISCWLSMAWVAQKVSEDVGEDTLLNHRVHNNKAQTGVRFLFCVTFSQSTVVDMSLHGDHGGGAAKRRRDRRLRMHWLHEQLSLQMALAAAPHHSRDVGPVSYNTLRSQKTARAEATNNALRSQTTSVAGDTEFSSLYEEELSGARPPPLVEVRPQERVLQHTLLFYSFRII